MAQISSNSLSRSRQRPPLAYLIQVHKDPDVATRLIRAIYDPDNFYLVHVDSRSPASVTERLQRELADLDKVRFLRQMPTKWGSWVAVEMELEAIRKLLAWNSSWQHYLNISGQDFPLWTQQELREFLQARPGVNLVEIQDPRNPPDSQTPEEAKLHESRWNRFYLDVKCPWKRRRLLSLPFLRRGFPSGVAWYRGASWKNLSRAFCEYLTDPRNERVQALARFFQHAECSDENFIPTVLMNSIHKEAVENDYHRFVRWPGPRTLTDEDYDQLNGSTDFFARKFDPNVDPQIILRLEKDLRTRKARESIAQEVSL